ncbi:MAG: MoxR family ATPase [Xenococcaceae cyanobacterium MO_167.B52]|nr:MoxR family ATPase [Xenococcaceae cyanobacterium MO_167.B52]
MQHGSSVTIGLSGKEIYQRIHNNITQVVKGQSVAIRSLLAAFASGGHVLLDDYPGTGKTTLAKALARSIDAKFKRIQFTPDLLPSDILGISIFDQNDRSFRFHEGPIFANIVLVDEINRASPRTQSALLEAMAESQVSIDGQIKKLKDLFFTIATQNPVGSHGTYPLPEAQMDRFSLKFSLGYISKEEEVNILSSQMGEHPIDSIKPCVSLQDAIALKGETAKIRVGEDMKRYVIEIINSTRSAPGVQLGASPRGSLALMKIAQALALFDGSDFVAPEHIQELAISAIAHRLVLEPQARFGGITSEGVVEEILQSIPVPA